MSEGQAPEQNKEVPAELMPVDTEFKKAEFQFKDRPSRAELRSILKTGKGPNGEEVHPDSRKLLQTARLIDLEEVGNQFNKANARLYEVMQQIIKNTDIAISEDRTNFYAFLSFLIDQGILGETAVEDYYKFKATFIENLNKAGEFLKQKEEEVIKQREEMVAKAQQEAKDNPNGPKLIVP